MDTTRKSDRLRLTAWKPDELSRENVVPGTALIGKAFRVIDVIGAAPGLVKVPELVTATGWPRPTLYRILAAVTAHGFVRFDPIAQGYTLGYRFLELAQNVWAAPDLAAVASIELQRLRDMTGETAYLAVPHDGAMVGLGKFEGVHVVRSAARLGTPKPMHCTSQGKAVLAYLSEVDVDRLVGKAPLEPFTLNTITDPALLKAQLAIVRQRGYAIEDEEILVGNRCVGAPIFDNAERPVAAISVAGPIWRLTRERVEQLGPEIVAVARSISMQLRGPTGAASRDTDHPLAHPGARDPAFYGADPSWDSRTNTLHWVDRLGPRLYATSDLTSLAVQPDTEAPIDCASLTRDGMLTVMAGRRMRLRGNAFVSDEPLRTGGRITAITTAPDGRLWAASNDDLTSTVGLLGEDGTWEPVWTINAQVGAMVWDRDAQHLYAADPSRGVIYALQRSARIPRILTRIPRVSGEPRGLAIDPHGRLWTVLYDGWSIARLSIEGEFDRVTALPVPRPTGITFGGPDGQSVFVTSARVGLAREVLDKASLSGRLLVIRSKTTAANKSENKPRRRTGSRKAQV